MNEYKVLGTVWFWALIALIIALHVCTSLLRGRKAEIIPVIANAGTHLALFFLMFMCEAEVSELLLALLISLSTALLCRSISNKVKSSGKDSLEKGE